MRVSIVLGAFCFGLLLGTGAFWGYQRLRPQVFALDPPIKVLEVRRNVIGDQADEQLRDIRALGDALHQFNEAAERADKHFGEAEK